MTGKAGLRVRARRVAPVCLLSTWVMLGLVTIGTPGFAADADPQAPTFDDLLRRTERQISEGHVIAPLSDSALETWSQVLQVQSLAPPSDEIRKSLTEFVANARARAAEERTAGHLPVSIDFTVFADLATQLLNHVTDFSPRAESPPPMAEAPVAEAPMATAPMATAPMATALAPQPEPEPKPPEAAVSIPPPAPAAVVAPAAPVVEVPPDPGLAAFYLRRGDGLLATKDISGARKFYEFAANGGSARAATTLARTYEPAFLGQVGVFGLKPDPALAKLWYSRAAALGDQEAVAKLQALGTAAAK